MHSKLLVGFSCLALLIVLLIYGRSSVDAQGYLCHITNMQVNPGQGVSVPAGQPVEFSVTLIGSCGGEGIFIFRADISDSTTQRIIATGQVTSFTNGQFVIAVNESAMAPAAVGSWGLQLSGYVLWNGAVVAPTSEMTFGLQVVSTPVPEFSGSFVSETLAFVISMPLFVRRLKRTANVA